MSHRPHKAEDAWRAAGYATRRSIPPLTAQEATAAARKLWRREYGAAVGGKPKRVKSWRPAMGPAVLYPPKRIELTSGNRRNDFRDGVLFINPGAGWHDLIHDLSHEIHYRLHPNLKPHDRKQHIIEARMVRYAVEKGWLAGALRREPKAKPPAPPKPSLMERRAARAKATLARAQHRLALAQAAVKRLKPKVRYYERALAQKGTEA